MQPHLPLWEGLYSVRCHASGRCLQLGKFMGMLYPGPVSRHNLVSLLFLWYLVPIWDRLCFATTVVVDAFGRHRATHDLASGELVGVSGRLSWQWEGFVGMPLVHPKMGVRGHGFCGVGKVCYLCRVY